MDHDLISIGKLAKATGFSVVGLRGWEQRYGSPQGQRLDSGHRRYSPSEVERLRLVRDCLERGLRPRNIVAQSRASLLGFLEKQLLESRLAHEMTAAWTPGDWVLATTTMDEAYLNKNFGEQWQALGPMRFMQERAEPFIRALGEAWRQGSICIADEHFGSEKIGDFLSNAWRPLNQSNERGPVLVTTFPGELHRLGLQMLAMTSVLVGLKVLYLGPNLPLEEAVAAVKRLKVKGLFLSMALGSDSVQTTQQLLDLHQALGPQVTLVVGGAGAPPPPSTAPTAWMRFVSLETFYLWARAWVHFDALKEKAAA